MLIARDAMSWAAAMRRFAAAADSSLRGCRQQLRDRQRNGRNVLKALARLQELVVWVRGFRNQLITVGAAWWALRLRNRMCARWPKRSPQRP